METIKSYNYKKILEGVVNIINTAEKSDIGFANICAYIGENCPELKEREDSRMKQAFIRLVKAYHGVNFPTPEGFTRDDMLAWLEKQGEQTPNKIELNFKVSDYGQKSAWSEEDDDNMMLIEDRLGDYLEYIMEDSTLTKHQKNTLKEEVFEYMNWLKSLKDRVQPKQEWSMYDETILKAIIDHFENKKEFNEAEDYDIVKWLKSLRPQNVWISVDEELYVKEPVLAQKKDKSDPFKGYVVCCDHTLTPNVYERYYDIR